MLIIRKLNCIDAASGIVTLIKWLFGAQFEREQSSLSTCPRSSEKIADVASIQFIFLMMSM